MGQQRGHQGQQQAKQGESQQDRAATERRTEDPVDAVQEVLGTRAASRQWRAEWQQEQAGEGNPVQPMHQLLQSISTSPRSQGKPKFRGVSQEWGGASSGLVVQPKLTIGEPNDRYEQEADRVAQQVVQQIQSPPVAQASAGVEVQRLTEEDEEELQRKSESLLLGEPAGEMAASGELEASIRQARGGGAPLPETLRKPMERAFGADFSGVRIHANTQADQLNRSISAKAFTTGQDVFVRQGAYQPGSREGQELLAHELTHVVQQEPIQAIEKNRIQKQVGNEASPLADMSSQSLGKDSLIVQRLYLKEPYDNMAGISFDNAFTKPLDKLGAAIKAYRNAGKSNKPNKLITVGQALRALSSTTLTTEKTTTYNAVLEEYRQLQNPSSVPTPTPTTPTPTTPTPTPTPTTPTTPTPTTPTPTPTPPTPTTPTPTPTTSGVTPSSSSAPPVPSSTASSGSRSATPFPIPGTLTLIEPTLRNVHAGVKTFILAGKKFADVHPINGIGIPSYSYPDKTEITPTQTNVQNRQGIIKENTTYYAINSFGKLGSGYTSSTARTVKVIDPVKQNGKPGYQVVDSSGQQRWVPDAGFEDQTKSGYIFMSGRDRYWVANDDTVTESVQLGDRSAEALEPTGGYKAQQVLQGEIGDCFLMAALASIVKSDPTFPTQMLQDNGDGTVTVRLYRVTDSTKYFSGSSGATAGDMTPGTFACTPEFIRVKKQVPRKNGRDLYAGEYLWVQMVERAYAAGAFGGNLTTSSPPSSSYESIGEGSSEYAFEVLLGEQTNKTDLKEKWNRRGKLTPEQVYETIFNRIKTALDDRKAVAAGTRELTEPEQTQSLTQNLGKLGKAGEYMLNGIVAGHAYTVVSVTGTSASNWKITLRNPWGNYGRDESGNIKNDGASDDNGTVVLTMPEFFNWFTTLSISGAVVRL
jgi:hypothetical protein